MGRVLVLGNAGLDLGLKVRRLPARGETLLGNGASRAPGGKGLNQAVVAARAGAAVVFQAAISADAQGDAIADALRAEDCLVFDPLRLLHPTDFSLLMVLPDGENSIVSAGGCAAAFSTEAAVAFTQGAQRGDVLLLQGNLSADSTRAAAETASRRGATVLFNTAPLWWDVQALLPCCGVVVANRGEAEAITGLPDAAQAAAALRSAGAAVAIITLGAEGCLVQQGERVEVHRAVPVSALDTTGCGDTFCGVLAAMLAGGRGLDDAVEGAQRAAAITATRPGAFAALPSREELSGMFTARGGQL
jgi:ribokinase